MCVCVWGGGGGGWQSAWLSVRVRARATSEKCKNVDCEIINLVFTFQAFSTFLIGVAAPSTPASPPRIRFGIGFKNLPNGPYA